MFLILGALFLIVDLGVWDFWGVSWWTAVFIVMGLKCLGMSKCKKCK